VLNARGNRKARGGIWDAMTVQNLLARAAYWGQTGAQRRALANRTKLACRAGWQLASRSIDISWV